jgi:hypothetical protein
VVLLNRTAGTPHDSPDPQRDLPPLHQNIYFRRKDRRRLKGAARVKGALGGQSSANRRDMRCIISDVMIQTLLSAIVISNSSTSKFPRNSSKIEIPAW